MNMTMLLSPYSHACVAQLSSGRLYTWGQLVLPDSQVTVGHAGSSFLRNMPPSRNGHGPVLDCDVGPQFTLEISYL